METKINSALFALRDDVRGALCGEALRLEQEGRSVLKLNTGDPARFGFPVPESIQKAIAPPWNGAAYSPSSGDADARNAILAYHKSRGIEGAAVDDVFPGNGVSEMAQILAFSLLEPGDEILLPSPNYSLWENVARLARAVPVFYPCREENGWEPDAEEVSRRITPRTRALLLIHPNNPTGAVYSVDTVRALTEVARKHGLILISDEIYDRLILDDTPFVSTAVLAPDLLCITLNGLSKSHVACGLRSGWGILSGPEPAKRPLREALARLCSLRLCANSAGQRIIPAALSDPDFTERLLLPRGRLMRQREATCRALEQIEGVFFVKNRAAYYLFPKLDRKRFGIVSDATFALDLLYAKNLLLVPSSAFGWDGNDHFRIVMLPREEILTKAMKDLGDFLSDYHQAP